MGTQTAREKAEELRQEAIRELLDEKQAIEGMLKTLGYDVENIAASRRRGRTARQEPPSPTQEQESPVIAQPEA